MSAMYLNNSLLEEEASLNSRRVNAAGDKYKNRHSRVCPAGCLPKALHLQKQRRIEARIPQVATRASDAEVEFYQRSDSELAASSSSPGPFPLDVADTKEKAEERRKSKILLDILTAGESVESVIFDHRDDIDEQLLELLDRRTRLAARMRESGQAIAGLKLVHRRLSMEVDRRRASPAQRLLNELLQVMAPTTDVEPQEQAEEVERLLHYAFQPAPSPHVDIFATAARVARGEEVELPKSDMDDRIPRHIFVWETEKLLQEGTKNAQELKRRIDRKHMKSHEEIYKHTLRTRLEALQMVSQILEVAKRMHV